MGIEESRPVHLMEFRRDVDGDYHYEPNGVACSGMWVILRPVDPDRPDGVDRNRYKWRAQHLHITMFTAPTDFDTLEAAALWILLEVGND